MDEESVGWQKQDSNPFVALLQGIEDGLYPIAVIRAGFEACVLLDAAEYFGISASRIYAIVGLSDASARRYIGQGTMLNTFVSERIWRLADVSIMATRAFEDRVKAQIWLRTAHTMFLGEAPIDQIKTEPGTMAVYQILQSIMSNGDV